MMKLSLTRFSIIYGSLSIEIITHTKFVTISHLHKCIKKSSFHVAMKLVCIMFYLKRTLNIFLPYKYCMIKFVYYDGALRVCLEAAFFVRF